MLATAAFQLGLFDGCSPAVDGSFATLRRVQLDECSWVDHAPGWLAGADRLFLQLLMSLPWSQRSRRMYDRRVLEPRLTSWWQVGHREPLPPVVDEMRLRLSARYGVELDSAGFNLYRDGRDSVAWHADRIDRSIAEPLVALVSLGEPRRFLLRPVRGGPSVRFVTGRGDLLVTGGAAQRRWQHCVPKTARAGPRISIGFRHDLDARAYARKRVVTTSGAGDAPEPLRSR